ncbi:MAG: cyclic nucleotide-binding domain-containing protein, partial [Bacteroidaceae bacterium]|nr:cyclic nucleotide-binding domain-containing protein [Bacteroidaceae bacterium]
MPRKTRNIPEVLEKLSELCRHLTKEQIEELRENIFLQDYKKNEIIYREGDTPVHLFCLLSGKVKVFKNGVGGRNQTMRLYKPVE